MQISRASGDLQHGVELVISRAGVGQLTDRRIIADEWTSLRIFGGVARVYAHARKTFYVHNLRHYALKTRRIGARQFVVANGYGGLACYLDIHYLACGHRLHKPSVGIFEGVHTAM